MTGCELCNIPRNLNDINKEKKEITRDGDSFYSSIAHELERHGFSLPSHILRDYVWNGINDAKETGTKKEKAIIHEYIERMGEEVLKSTVLTPAAWDQSLCELILFVVSRIFGVDIHIYNTHKDFLEDASVFHGNEIIVRLVYNGMGHYDATTEKSEQSSAELPPNPELFRPSRKIIHGYTREEIESFTQGLISLDWPGHIAKKICSFLLIHKPKRFAKGTRVICKDDRSTFWIKGTVYDDDPPPCVNRTKNKVGGKDVYQVEEIHYKVTLDRERYNSMTIPLDNDTLIQELTNEEHPLLGVDIELRKIEAQLPIEYQGQLVPGATVMINGLVKEGWKSLNGEVGVIISAKGWNKFLVSISVFPDPVTIAKDNISLMEENNDNDIVMRRFPIGSRVICKIGGIYQWKKGTVDDIVSHDYSYRIELDIGGVYIPPQDNDTYICGMEDENHPYLSPEAPMHYASGATLEGRWNFGIFGFGEITGVYITLDDPQTFLNRTGLLSIGNLYIKMKQRPSNGLQQQRLDAGHESETLEYEIIRDNEIQIVYKAESFLGKISKDGESIFFQDVIPRLTLGERWQREQQM